jgi:hypothetical protein
METNLSCFQLDPLRLRKHQTCAVISHTAANLLVHYHVYNWHGKTGELRTRKKAAVESGQWISQLCPTQCSLQFVYSCADLLLLLSAETFCTTWQLRGTLKVFFVIFIIRIYTMKTEKLQLRGNNSVCTEAFVTARPHTRAAQREHCALSTFQGDPSSWPCAQGPTDTIEITLYINLISFSFYYRSVQVPLRSSSASIPSLWPSLWTVTALSRPLRTTIQLEYINPLKTKRICFI